MEWREYKIGDLCATISDTYHGNDAEVVLINTSDVLDGVVLNHTRVPNEDLKGQFKKTFQKDDILYSEIRPANRRFAYVDFDDTSAYIASTKLMVLRANRELVRPKYLYAILSSNVVVSEMQHLAETRSGTFPQITFSTELAPMEVMVPDFATQDIIIHVLDTIEGRIKNNTAINSNLEAQARILFENNYESKNDEDLPEEWNRIQLGEVASIVNKVFNPLREAEVMLEHYSIPAYDELKYPVFESSLNIKSNKFIVDKDCFMISKLNPRIKRVWKPYGLTDHAVSSTEFIVYKAKDPTLTNYLYTLINTKRFISFMCSHVTGSTGSRQRTTPSDTLRYDFVLPSREEIARFTAMVKPMHEKIQSNCIENIALKKLRDTLMPSIMSGTLDLSSFTF